ncbi:MAG: tripartite tricarboxylate transporter substrate binding protein [Alcaligenaceae bacterium]
MNASKFSIKQLFIWALIAFGLLAESFSCAAAFPERRVTIVVPYPPGGSTDIFARSIAHHLSQKWGQSVVTENRGGGGTVIGTQYVSQAPADGYTLLVVAYAYTSNPLLKEQLSYLPNALSPLMLIGTAPSLLYLNAKLSPQNLSEVLELAKMNPSGLVLGSSGNGSSAHIAAELFAHAASVKITHIPYKGMGPALNDLFGGQLMGIFDIPTGMTNVKAGRLKAIAIAATERHPDAPEVPTFKELGVEMVFGTWYGFFTAKDVPQSLQAQLHEALSQAVTDPAVKQAIARTGLVLQSRTQEEFRQFLHEETQKLSNLLKTEGVKITID